LETFNHPTTWTIQPSWQDCLVKYPQLIESSLLSGMSNEEAAKQFKSVIKSDLSRWFEESDLSAEDLAKFCMEALDDWLDEDIIIFTPNE
jgi:hypothetical protein